MSWHTACIDEGRCQFLGGVVKTGIGFNALGFVKRIVFAVSKLVSVYSPKACSDSEMCALRKIVRSLKGVSERDVAV